jgi:hypothetical protein
VAVTDLSWIHRQTGIHIDAVVGLDVLVGSTFQIDYQSREITLGTMKLPGSAVPIDYTHGLLTIQARINGSPLNLLLDTGSPILVLSPQSVPQLRTGKAGKIALSDPGGEALIHRVWLNNFRLGKNNLGGGIAFVDELRPDAEFQGILGISPLRFKRITFDLISMRVGFDLQNIAPTLDAPTWFGSEPGPLSVQIAKNPTMLSRH